MSGTFRSLKGHNYKLWAGAALVSNVGTWMQRAAQDWLVLAQLTNNNATALGVVMALQFGPQVFLLPLTGYVADTFDRRKILFITQGGLGLLALVLGSLVVTGHVQLWHVYLCALLLGCIAAFDIPTRQTFIAELVGDKDLANAVALNSTSFHCARMLGPAIAGVLIASIGTGWVFLINGVSFSTVLCALALIRVRELHRSKREARTRVNLLEGFRYVWNRPDLKVVLVMIFLLGAFGLNFQLFISTMAVGVFNVGAGQYGLLTSVMAVGSVLGALYAAGRERPTIPTLTVAAALFGLGCALASIMPSYLLFALSLAPIGLFAQILTTSTNSLMQLSTTPEMRGRVIAITFAVFMGSTPLGSLIEGWVADILSPRWALSLAAAAGFSSVAVGVGYLLKHRHAQPRYKIKTAPVRMKAESPSQPPPGTGELAASRQHTWRGDGRN